MNNKQIFDDTTKEAEKLIKQLKELRHFEGSPQEFWTLFFQKSIKLVQAEFGILMVKGEDGEWKEIFAQKGEGVKVKKDALFFDQMKTAAASLNEDGYFSENSQDIARIVAIRIDSQQKGDAGGAALFFIKNIFIQDIKSIIDKLLLLADIPMSYQALLETRQTKDDAINFAETMDLMVLLNHETKYMGTAMTLCNEIASRYKCSRVSLGLLEGGYIRINAISHMDKFEKKMDAVQSLEKAMEEAFDQDEEILIPHPKDSTSIIKDHEEFCKMYGAKFVISLPIRLEDKPIGILTCERETETFTEDQIKGIRVICDQSARRLDELKKRDKWFGPKLLESWRERLGKYLGFENTFIKLTAIIIFFALAFLFFGRLNYRVEAPCLLKTDDLKYLPAPFDGYIYEVNVEAGDIVKKDKILVKLNTAELLLEESSAIANQQRYQRESEKARAEDALADMQIASALADQSSAQLAQVRYHLDNAEIKAPFSGIVVEGDLKELLGAPVKKGDILFKIAMLEKLYVELNVDERDIQEVFEGAKGEISFLSRAGDEFPIKVEKIEPVAVAKEKGNVFTLRCALTGKNADWFRPGMSGIGKISVGTRNVFWIITHRTVDFLRLFLWW